MFWYFFLFQGYDNSFLFLSPPERDKKSWQWMGEPVDLRSTGSNLPHGSDAPGMVLAPLIFIILAASHETFIGKSPALDPLNKAVPPAYRIGSCRRLLGLEVESKWLRCHCYPQDVFLTHSRSSARLATWTRQPSRPASGKDSPQLK